MANSPVIRKSNVLIRAEGFLAPDEEKKDKFEVITDVLPPKLTVPANRLITALVEKINRTPSDLNVELILPDFEKQFGLKTLSPDEYKDCIKAISRVAYGVNTECGYAIFPMFEAVEFIDTHKGPTGKNTKRKIIATFTVIGAKFINEINPYTLYEQAEYNLLTSMYGQLLFEILKSWENNGSVQIKILDLQKKLHFPDVYIKQKSAFKRYLLDAAKKEMKKKLGFEWDYKLQPKYNADTIYFFFNDVNKEEKKFKPKQAAYLCAKNKADKLENCDIYSAMKCKRDVSFENAQEESKCTQCSICKYLDRQREQRFRKREQLALQMEQAIEVE